MAHLVVVQQHLDALVVACLMTSTAYLDGSLAENLEAISAEAVAVFEFQEVVA